MSNTNNVDSGPGRGRQRITKHGLFVKDIPSMMYSFGDSEPQKDVINLMEDMVVEHITDVLSAAHRVSTNRGKLRIEDIMFALRQSATATHSDRPSFPHSSTTTSTTTTTKTPLIMNVNNRITSNSTAAGGGGGHNHYISYPLAQRKLTLSEKQLSRIEELLFMQEDLKRARGSAADLAGFGTEDVLSTSHGNSTTITRGF